MFDEISIINECLSKCLLKSIVCRNFSRIECSLKYHSQTYLRQNCTQIVYVYRKDTQDRAFVEISIIIECCQNFTKNRKFVEISLKSNDCSLKQNACRRFRQLKTCRNFTQNAMLVENSIIVQCLSIYYSNRMFVKMSLNIEYLSKCYSKSDIGRNSTQYRMIVEILLITEYL